MSTQPPSPSRIGVVVVTFRPTAGIEARLQAMRSQGEVLVVVDNASATAQRELLRTNCARLGGVLIANEENIGLAAALNQGVAQIRANGCEWALLFDQDSEPPEGMGRRLLADCEAHPDARRVGVIGPDFCDAATGETHRFLCQNETRPWLFRKSPVTERVMLVTMVITSGSLVNLVTYEEVGPFDERLFIDFIDTDFCLRCRQRGWKILASSSVQMVHRLGARTVRRWCGVAVRPTHHSPLRHYYIARNRVQMIRRHGWAEKHWFWFEGAAAFFWMARVLSVERSKGRKLVAILLGTWDGLLGRSGKCPPRRQRWFDR